MSRLCQCLRLLFVFSSAVWGQNIAIYSEFERFDPWGQIVIQDREPAPREILSPAVPRNGHLSVHVVVTAPGGTNYFLYTASSPQDVVQVRLYREHFMPCGNDYCSDWLTELRSPAFGVMPESQAMPGQTTRSYLLDVWVPPGVPPRRVRLEALLKTASWLVAPMEIRVIDALVPGTPGLTRENIAPVGSQSSETARTQLLRYVNGLPPEMPLGILRVRDAIQRNAAEDALLALSYGLNGPAMMLPLWPSFGYLQPGAEWYLRVRDQIRTRARR
ncbi:MAG: hypothetical protein ABJC09_16730 [Terriglobia bacterium]